MALPVEPPVKPMLCKPATALPEGDRWTYEPKWDGFRCIVFRDGDDVVLGSRNEKPLTRYFPELLPVLREALPERCVVDGEIVLPAEAGARVGLDFDALQQRIHPADSRVRMLAEKTPASFVAFDLLALGDEDLMGRPFEERRATLEAVLGGRGARPAPAVLLTPVTRDLEVARSWFDRFEGAGLDGIIAKADGVSYQPDKRVLVKVKHARTADCVVAGFRWHKNGEGTAIGSLLLGLWTDEGDLAHVGVIGAFPMATRRALVDELAPLKDGVEDHPWAAWAINHGETHETQNAHSRWNAKKDLTFTLLRPERVVEVKYDQLQGHRFRHAGQFGRWRPDRDPASCGYEQLDAVAPAELSELFPS